MTLIHDHKLPPSFNSGRWRRGYNLENIFVNEGIAAQCVKEIGKPIRNAQHRPILCKVTSTIMTHTTTFKRRYNFKIKMFKEDGDISAKVVPSKDLKSGIVIAELCGRLVSVRRESFLEPGRNYFSVVHNTYRKKS